MTQRERTRYLTPGQKAILEFLYAGPAYFKDTKDIRSYKLSERSMRSLVEAGHVDTALDGWYRITDEGEQRLTKELSR